MPVFRTGGRRLALGIVLLLAAGCAEKGQGVGAPSVPVDEIAAQLEQVLAERDGVAGADVRYSDDLSNPSNVTVDMTMEPGADAQVIYEAGARLIWRSELQPLTSFAINVIDRVHPPAGVSRIVSLTQDSERRPLEERYGPR